MENSIKASGETTKCTVKEHSSGQMAGFMLESITKIKNTVMEEFNGLMEKYIRAIGEKEFKTVRGK